MNLDTLSKIAVGTTGVVASQVSETAITQISEPQTGWLNAIVQVVIAVSTIISLIKKSKHGKN